jgi:hypothetical protein
MDHDLFADHHAVADLERLDVTQADAWFDPKAGPATPGQGANAGSPHQVVDMVPALIEAAEQSHDLGWRAALRQILGERDLEGRIGLDRLPAVNGPGDARGSHQAAFP